MEHLVMPFDEAVRFKELGGSQDTIMTWLKTDDDRPPRLYNTKTVRPYWEDEFLFAAPIIKTEYQV